MAEEVLAVDELHREEELVALAGDQLVQVHEVGVQDVREGSKLLLELVEAGARPSAATS